MASFLGCGRSGCTNRIFGLGLSAAVVTLSPLWGGSALAQGLYRWVDEQGAVHYSDKIPPAQAAKARARLSEKGIQVEEVSRAPTAEEIEKAKELERRRAEEEKRLAEQRAADERLLKTYTTLEDLELTRNGKIAAVDATIQMTRDHVRLETNRLLDLNAEIAALQKKAKPVPDALRAKVGRAVNRIRDGYSDVVRNEYRKRVIRDDYSVIIDHYSELKGLPAADVARDSAESGLKRAILVTCDSRARCNRYWQRANDYVRGQSNVETEVTGPGLLIGFHQDEREKRSYTLSWTQAAADEPVHLYLDVQCKNRQTGSLHCPSSAISEIRDGFQSAVVRLDDPQ